MKISKIIIENFKSLKSTRINLNEKLNIIVGDNEVGKSSLLEAVNLALSGQIDGKNIGYDLHPFLFNTDCIREYLEKLQKGETPQPPHILIEVYFHEDENLVDLKGSINTLKEDCPGVSFSLEFDESFATEYSSYIKNPKDIRTIPVEYYRPVWRSFSSYTLTARSIPIKPIMIDASNIRHNTGPNKYVLDVITDTLGPEQKALLSLSYRKMKDQFLDDPSIKEINDELAKKTGAISEKQLSVALDNTARAKWENGVMPHLDDIPFPLVGKGEQSSIKIQLAMEASDDAHIFLIEEPENHLSHTNLNALISKMSDHSGDRQLLVTTHSSFVLNKLGIESVVLFNGESGITLNALTPETRDYFLKLSGHDTLRLILAEKVILVEGPSDELIIQRAYLDAHEKMPLQDGVDVVTVNSLAFKRFLEISKLLDIETKVVTDNDGKVAALKSKYAEYEGDKKIEICFDDDEATKTLEPQILKANDLGTLNGILEQTFETDQYLLDYMENNKTKCALMIFNSKSAITYPEYIKHAVRK